MISSLQEKTREYLKLFTFVLYCRFCILSPVPKAGKDTDWKLFSSQSFSTARTMFLISVGSFRPTTWMMALLGSCPADVRIMGRGW